MTQPVPHELQRTITRWTNPLKDTTLKVNLYTGTGVAKNDRRMNPTGYRLITWQPGQSIDLPAEYDDAIQQLDRATGKIVGGLCPQLLKEGQRHEVHPALDTTRSAATNAADAYLAAATAKAEAEARAKLAEEQAAAAAKRLDEVKESEAQAIEAAKQKEAAQKELALKSEENERLKKQLDELMAKQAASEKAAAKAKAKAAADKAAAKAASANADAASDKPEGDGTKK